MQGPRLDPTKKYHRREAGRLGGQAAGPRSPEELEPSSTRLRAQGRRGSAPGGAGRRARGLAGTGAPARPAWCTRPRAPRRARGASACRGTPTPRAGSQTWSSPGPPSDGAAPRARGGGGGAGPGGAHRRRPPARKERERWRPESDEPVRPAASGDGSHSPERWESGPASGSSERFRAARRASPGMAFSYLLCVEIQRPRASCSCATARALRQAVGRGADAALRRAGAH